MLDWGESWSWYFASQFRMFNHGHFLLFLSEQLGVFVIKDAPRYTAAPAQSQPRAELSHAFCPAGGRTRAGGYGPPPYRSREKSRRGSTSSGNLGRRWPSVGLCPPSAWALCGSCSPWRVDVPSSQVSCYMQASTEKRERKDNSHSDALVFGSHAPGG